MLPDQTADLISIARHLAVDAGVDPVDNLLDRSYSEICRDERLFELFQQFGIDFFFAGKYILQPVNQSRPRLFHAGFQAIKKRRFRRNTTEESLDGHEGGQEHRAGAVLKISLPLGLAISPCRVNSCSFGYSL